MPRRRACDADCWRHLLKDEAKIRKERHRDKKMLALYGL